MQAEQAVSGRDPGLHAGTAAWRQSTTQTSTQTQS